MVGGDARREGRPSTLPECRGYAGGSGGLREVQGARVDRVQALCEHVLHCGRDAALSLESRARIDCEEVPMRTTTAY